jgi:hypothetical protein|nr:MAG TPA: hypothetical protein [Caudoviricetes sp.]DAN81680.1 MAG TPA: hypothetical protein [Caudoviricetes sp.]
MAKKKNSDNTNKNFWDLLNSKVNIVVSSTIIITAIFGSGAYSSSLLKKIEMLKMQEEYTLRIIKYEEEISILKIENDRLKHENDKLKNLNPEKNNGKKR